MCGVVGIATLEPASLPDREVIEAMRDEMVHRGPDGEGIYLGEGVALGHRRLSIVDLAGGAQPMPNGDRTVWLTYNGELYNHLELRDMLISRGYEFRTRSDTETIVHLYEEFGEQCVDHMKGMFAFAIWDERRRRCFLARDRLGIKPLYYWVHGNTLVFASEIKAILKHPDVPAGIDETVLREFLTYRYVAGPRTFFRGVQRLLPGHSLLWERGRAEVRSYWRLPKPRERHEQDASFTDLRDLIAECVSSHRMSDVPLGAFCSGGVDSGVVTAQLAQLSADPVETFAVGFEEEEWDERSDALKVSRRWGTVHHEYVMNPGTFVDSLERAAWHFDEPVSHPNSIPLMLLSDFAKTRVTVVLTGEGSDEVFGGYPRYLIAGAHHALDGLGGGFRRSVGRLGRRLPLRRLQKLGVGLGLDQASMMVTNSAFVDSDLVDALCPDAGCGGSLAYRYEGLEQLRQEGFEGLDLLMSYEIGTYLVSALDRMDKMSMAASLEARVPLVDHELVEYGQAMPVRDRIHGLQSKYAIKKIAEQYLPHELIYKRKSGFGLPLAQWFRSGGRFKALLERVRESEPCNDYLDPKVVGRVIDEHVRGQMDHSEVLWLLLNLTLWHDTFLGNAATR